MQKEIKFHKLKKKSFHEGWSEGVTEKNYEFEHQAKEAFEKELKSYQNGISHGDKGFDIEVESETSFCATYDDGNRCDYVSYFPVTIKFES